MNDDLHDIVDLLTATTPRERVAIARGAIEYLKQGHCQGALAKTAQGAPVTVWAPDAREWSILGAIRRATDDVVGTAKADPYVVKSVAASLQSTYPSPEDPPKDATSLLFRYNDRLKLSTETFIGVLNTFITEQKAIMQAEELAQESATTGADLQRKPMKLDYSVTLSPQQAQRILLLINDPIATRIRGLDATGGRYLNSPGIRADRVDLCLEMKATAEELLELLDIRARMLCVIAYYNKKHSKEHEND